MASYEATAYGPPWDAMEGTGITSKGVNLKKGVQKLVVAVDPTVIPYGTKLKIWPNPFGDRNLVFTAADTGGAFQGGVKKIDFFVASGRKDQNRWGRRNVSVKIVGRGSPKDVAILGESLKSGGVTGGGVTEKKVGPVTSTNPLLRQQALLAYAQNRNNPNALLELAGGLQAATTTTMPSAGSTSDSAAKPRRSPRNGSQGLSPLLELFWQGEGGINAKNGKKVPQGFVSGHTDHVHVAAGPKTIVRLGKRAKDFGLHVGENAAFDGSNPTSGHAPNSYHYKGEAIDVSGSPKQMKAYARYIARLYGVSND